MIRRRDLFLTLAASGVVVTTRAGSAAPTAVAGARDKRKAQYQGNSPEVQTFYRVNRYPAKR
jgi:hypothetical protein